MNLIVQINIGVAILKDQIYLEANSIGVKKRKPILLRKGGAKPCKIFKGQAALVKPTDKTYGLQIKLMKNRQNPKRASSYEDFVSRKEIANKISELYITQQS